MVRWGGKEGLEWSTIYGTTEQMDDIYAVYIYELWVMGRIGWEYTLGLDLDLDMNLDERALGSGVGLDGVYDMDWRVRARYAGGSIMIYEMERSLILGLFDLGSSAISLLGAFGGVCVFSICLLLEIVDRRDGGCLERGGGSKGK